MKQLYSKKAVTLMEIMVVIIILSMAAAFAIPNYRKTLESNEEKAGVSNLMVLNEAFRLYFSREGQYVDTVGYVDVTPFWNDKLGVHVLEDKLQYRCDGSTTSYECKATADPNYGWQLKIKNDVLGGRPYCVPLSNPCPDCKDENNGGCPVSL